MVAHAESKLPYEVGFHIDAWRDETSNERKTDVRSRQLLEVEFVVGALHVHALLGQVVCKRAFVDVLICIYQEHNMLVCFMPLSDMAEQPFVEELAGL